MARIAAGLLVSALVRRVQGAGGNAAVLARGEPTAGAVLVQVSARGMAGDLLERTLDASGTYCWIPTGPADPEAQAAYLARRRRIDPDLWVLELDHEDATAILNEVTGAAKV